MSIIIWAEAVNASLVTRSHPRDAQTLPHWMDSMDGSTHSGEFVLVRRLSFEGASPLTSVDRPRVILDIVETMTNDSVIPETLYETAWQVPDSACS